MKLLQLIVFVGVINKDLLQVKILRAAYRVELVVDGESLGGKYALRIRTTYSQTNYKVQTQSLAAGSFNLYSNFWIDGCK